MKHVIIITLFLSCCLHASGQNYLQEATACFEKGDYECAKKNYTLFQTLDGKDMTAQIQLADECQRTRNLADEYNRSQSLASRDNYFHLDFVTTGNGTGL